MAKGETAKKIAQLADKIMSHKAAYYKGVPTISDVDYDKLEEDLRALSPSHPALMSVGSEESIMGDKVPHSTPMLSLQKVYTQEELFSWQDGRNIMGTWKIDGNSLSLVYKKGQLVMAKTRGNGRFGEDVTDKAKWVSDVVASIDEEWDFEVRGELYCSSERFFALSKEMVALNLPRPTSPRNIVAGMLGRKTHFNLSRFFNFLAFDVLFFDGKNPFKEEKEKFQWFEKKGFALPGPRSLKSQKEVLGYLEDVKNLMNEGEISLDGAVFSFSDLSLQEQMGHTSHHPRFKMSFKWQGETKVVEIKDFTFQTSRHGVVTPVAVISPCELSGASITNITLHNAQHLKTYNLKVGDKIEIVRSGEVIPKFLRVVTEAEGEHVWLDQCPSCGEGLFFDEVRLLCKNHHHCPAQIMGGILNWIRCAEIEDLSEKRLSSMIELSLVKNASDLYHLTLEDFLKLPLTKEKMAQKLLMNIEKSKSLPLFRFLTGLSIGGLGFSNGEKLAMHFGDLAAVRQAKLEEIAALEGFAEKTAKEVVDTLAAKSDLIDALLEGGVLPLSAAKPAAKDGFLANKQLAITGKLTRPRKEIEDVIKAEGGKVSSSVSKNTFAVVTGDVHSSSSKMEKARKLGVQIWSEDDLIEKMKG